jgi:toxin HigB-1
MNRAEVDGKARNLTILVRRQFPNLVFPLALILIAGNLTRVIKNFADAETGKVFRLEESRKLPGEIQTRAKVKLDQLHAASELNHLRIPPSNRLEKLSGKLRNYHSIRINQQWRIIFIWKDTHAHQVQITDYH